jgi:hypothetical protein
MANKFYVIRDLEKQYAKLLGRYDAAERKVENAKGLAAIDAATASVAEERAELRRQMEAIRLTIRANYDPKWSAEGIKPIRASITGERGDLSAATYGIMKEAGVPLSTGELIIRVGSRLNLDLTDPDVRFRLKIGIKQLLERRAKEGLVVKTGKPIHWSPAPRPRLVPVVSSNTLPTPWR